MSPAEDDVPRAEAASDRLATVPNLISLGRLLLTPLFVVLILRRQTQVAGLLLMIAVVSTDWIDGYIARHTAQVSNVGKVLDPVADRLALAAALVALVIRNAIPLWVALLVVVRDALVLLAGALLLVLAKVRIDVRWIGKAATFALMVGVPAVAWGNLGLWAHGTALVVGWPFLVVGLVAYYIATALYIGDVVRAVRRRRLSFPP